jgi:hypothetical protein
MHILGPCVFHLLQLLKTVESRYRTTADGPLVCYVHTYMDNVCSIVCLYRGKDSCVTGVYPGG